MFEFIMIQYTLKLVDYNISVGLTLLLYDQPPLEYFALI